MVMRSPWSKPASDARKNQGFFLDSTHNLDKIVAMSKVTGKFQITLPKRIVDTYGIKVGDDVDLLPAGNIISLVPARAKTAAAEPLERLADFDRATERQRKREKSRTIAPGDDRGWRREDLYRRDRPR